MLDLVPPHIPELREAVNKQHEGFLRVSGLHVVDLDTVNCQVLVGSQLRVSQAFGREDSLLDLEDATSEDDEPDREVEEEGGDGEEESKESATDSAPVHLHVSELLED